MAYARDSHVAEDRDGQDECGVGVTEEKVATKRILVSRNVGKVGRRLAKTWVPGNDVQSNAHFLAVVAEPLQKSATHKKTLEMFPVRASSQKTRQRACERLRLYLIGHKEEGQ